MLRSLIPDKGWICAATAKTFVNKEGKDQTFFQHHWCETLEETEDYLARMDAVGKTMYLAQATFLTRDNRKHPNVQAIRSFWQDIDVGPGKPYDSQKDALIELRDFVQLTGLPFPAVVSSGNGLYAHWPLDRDLEFSAWKPAASLLHAICKACSFHVDPARAEDASSVLRPVGTTNRKNGAEKPVRLLRDCEPIFFDSFLSALQAAAERLSVDAKVYDPPTKTELNAEYLVEFSAQKPKAEPIAKQCFQIRHVVEKPNEISEPLWYAALTLVRHCEDGRTWGHEWSKGHEGYDPAETDKKLDALDRLNPGPTLCATLHDRNPGGCAGCRHKDKIASPIQLGRVFEDVKDPPPDLPDGYRLTTRGLVLGRDDAEAVNFYDRALYVTDLSWDDGLGYEVATIRHDMPHEGWKVFKIRSSLTYDPKALLMALADRHIKLVGKDTKGVMVHYIESYLSKVQRAKRMAGTISQMGWKDDGCFVVGTTVVRPDGGEEKASFAKTLPASVEGFQLAGEIQPWIEATEIFNQRNMEPFAFAFCAGAFGAPLMKFSGYPGAVVSLVGPSGSGKTWAGHMMLSTYGEPSKLVMLKDDTRNALLMRLGAYGNLPMFIDEVTNMPAEELSELVYRITQGRDKNRLTRNANERAYVNRWQTLALVSTNDSLLDKLSGLKQDASPEMNRIMEFRAEPPACLDRDTATRLYRITEENYGHAGLAYARELVKGRDVHRDKIDQLVRLLDTRTRARNAERYWSAIVGTTLYGAMIAKQAGLIRFDVSHLMDWVVKQIKGMRDTQATNTNSAVDTLGLFLDEHVHNRMIVSTNRNVPVVTPYGALYIRIETEAELMYISKTQFKRWCNKIHASYSSIRSELVEKEILLDYQMRKTLGAGGSGEYAGAQQPVWKINLRHPLLARVAARLVTEADKAMDLKRDEILRENEARH